MTTLNMALKLHHGSVKNTSIPLPSAIVCPLPREECDLAPRPFTAATRVRIPLGTPDLRRFVHLRSHQLLSNQRMKRSLYGVLRDRR